MENLILDPVETRVLGVLLEKEKSTPEYYPMSLHGIQTACNQKSSRNPVVQYDETTVQIGIDGLKRRGLVLTVSGGGSRVIKFKHNAGIVLDLETAEEAVLCLVLLRGPLTPGEIKSNSGRLFEFDSLEHVQQTLEAMTTRENPLLMQLPRKAGQKEARYMHLLNGAPDLSAWEEEQEPLRVQSSGLEERVRTLEAEVSELKEKLENLLKQLE